MKCKGGPYHGEEIHVLPGVELSYKGQTGSYDENSRWVLLHAIVRGGSLRRIRVLLEALAAKPGHLNREIRKALEELPK